MYIITTSEPLKFHHEISTDSISLSVFYSKSTVCDVKVAKLDFGSNEGGGGGERKME